ncbi:MAG: thioredoxin family protein [Nitrospirota bacterium]
MAAIKVFVKDGCSKCPAAKAVAGKLKSEGFDVQEYHMETAEGLAEGVFYGVLSTPTMMVVDREENEISAWRGTVPATEEVKRALTIN